MNATVHLSLGPSYGPTLWDVRKRVAVGRTSDEPLIFIKVDAPIVSDVIEVAIESGSLYLVGLRSDCADWWEFAPDGDEASAGRGASPRPRLPNSRWIKSGRNIALFSYRALRLGW